LLQTVFEITGMSPTQWSIVCGMAIVPLVIMEIVKAIQALFRKK
jgi:hypothetical protein